MRSHCIAIGVTAVGTLALHSGHALCGTVVPLLVDAALLSTTASQENIQTVSSTIRRLGVHPIPDNCADPLLLLRLCDCDAGGLPHPVIHRAEEVSRRHRRQKSREGWAVSLGVSAGRLSSCRGSYVVRISARPFRRHVLGAVAGG